MISVPKKILIINLNTKESEFKTFSDMGNYIGGVGLGIKLMQHFIDSDPLILAVGPLNGYFPYASKTAIVINETGVVEDLYIGGTLSLRIAYAGLDAIVINGVSLDQTVLNIQNTDVSFHPEGTPLDSLGLPGRRSKLKFNEGKFLLENYFYTPEKILEQKLIEKNISGMVITGTEIYKPSNMDRYQELYNRILIKKDDITINSGLNPSCSNCPIGCVKSKEGEIGGNVLLHSLVACQFAERIYSDIGIVFSCLNALGYEYTHEDIESLPGLIEKTIREL